MIVVSDTSPLINLAAVGQLDLLRQLDQHVTSRKPSTMKSSSPGLVSLEQLKSKRRVGAKRDACKIKHWSTSSCWNWIAARQKR
jgi:predicted nucleic acid-binding protein